MFKRTSKSKPGGVTVTLCILASVHNMDHPNIWITIRQLTQNHNVSITHELSGGQKNFPEATSVPSRSRAGGFTEKYKGHNVMI